MVVDAYLVYSFIRRLVTPFNKYPAFTAGLIDEKGNFLKDRKNFSPDERKALPLFDIMIINLKKLIAKVPFGKTRVATIAAALMLLRSKPAKKMNEDKNIHFDNLEEDFYRTMAEVESVMEEGEGGSPPINSTTGIAGLTPQTLGVPKKAAQKYKMKNLKGANLLSGMLRRNREI
jgi:hypothetical protein